MPVILWALALLPPPPQCTVVDKLGMMMMDCGLDPDPEPEPPPPVCPAPAERPIKRGRGGRSPVASFVLSPGYRALYGEHYAVGTLNVRIGGEPTPGSELMFDLIVGAGAAQLRMPMSELRFGISARGIFGRFRVGAGLRVGALMFRRITNGVLAAGAIAAPVVMGSVDLTRGRRIAVFLGLELGIDLVIFGVRNDNDIASSISAMLSGLLGVRVW
jgi:hypothetical protein